MKRIAWLALLLIPGCSKAPAPGKPESARSEPPLAAQVIDGMTGRTAVNQGRRAQDKIEKVSAQKNVDLKQVME